MKKSKIVSVLCCAAVLTLGIIGCGTAGESSSNTDADSVESKEKTSGEEDKGFIGITTSMYTNEAIGKMCDIIAENLERTHRSLAQSVKLIKKGQRLSIQVSLSAPTPLEEAAADKIRKHTKRVFGQAIDVQFSVQDRQLFLTDD